MSESGHAKPQGEPVSDQHRDDPLAPTPASVSGGMPADGLSRRPLDPLADPLAAAPVDPLADRIGDPLGGPLGGPLAGPALDPSGDPLRDRTTDPLADPSDAGVVQAAAVAAPADDEDDPTIRVRKPPPLPEMRPAAEPAATERRFFSWATTHVGTVRKHNEDSLVDRSDLGLWAVADGAGGHSRGDVASAMVVEALNGLPPDLSAGQMLSEVRQRMTDTNAALRASVKPPEICASTVVVLIARGEHFACLWAGDSRVYLLRGGTMTQVTRDHSLVQDMVEAGAIKAEDAESHPNANVITRAIGSGDELDLDKVTDRLLPGDRFLLCSDGLCKTLPDSLTAQLLASNDDPAGQLIQATLEHHGRDNVTAVVVDVLS